MPESRNLRASYMEFTPSHLVPAFVIIFEVSIRPCPYALAFTDGHMVTPAPTHFLRVFIFEISADALISTQFKDLFCNMFDILSII